MVPIPNTIPVSRGARTVAVTCACVVAAVCLLVLLGWAADISLLRRGLVGRELARPNAAMALLFAALSVLVGRHPLGRALAVIPFVIGALTTFEYVTGIDLGIDALLFDVPGLPMRMSVRAAIGVTFAGLAGIFIRRRGLSLGFAAAAGFVGLLSMTAYAYGARLLPEAPVTTIALSIAILLVLWASAFVAMHGPGSAASAFFLRDRWGTMARQLSAAAILVPAVFGAICLAADHAGWFDDAFALALITTASTATLVTTIGIYASRMRLSEAQSREADAMYRSIVETSQEGICVVDPSFRLTFVNRRLAAMLGYEPHEMIGRLNADFLATDELPVVNERDAERRGGKPSTRAEIRLRHRDGSIVHAISSATRLSEAGLQGCTLATLADITYRVQVENELRASEARFRSLYESNLIGIAFWSFERQVTDANDALRQILGVRKDEIPGWNWNAMNPPGGAELDDRVIAEVREHGRCGPFEKELVRADGSRIWILMAIASIDAETNVAFVVDVTERAQAQHQLERAHEILSARVQQLEGGDKADDRELDALAARLTEANEELETFSYSVSHDLRAPLRAIDGFSRELQTAYAHCFDETGHQYLRRVRAATQRMSQLIDDLLSLARLSRKPLNRQTVDVTAMAHEIGTEARERSGRPVAFDVEQNLTASADPHLLRVVLENIVGNAVKFSSRRENARVEVFDAGNGELAVRDNGAGFDARFADKIFVPFQRLHSTEFEGTGIGLALVQRIIRRHGGSIRADSTPGQGATFYFHLPPSGDSRA